MAVCRICNGSGRLLRDVCPLCDGVPGWPNHVQRSIASDSTGGDVLPDQHTSPLLLPNILRQQAGCDWDRAKEILANEFDLVVNEHDDLFSITYASLGSATWRGTPEQQLMSSQCRGAIFCIPHEATSQPYRCVCLPFLKFWNNGEKKACKIAEPWDEGVRVQEKLDGHLMKLFHHSDSWRLAGNSSLDTADAEDAFDGRCKKDLFLDALRATTGLGLADLQVRLDQLGIHYCHIFEVLHPSNVVIVPVKSPRLAHIGSRNMQTLHEEDVDIGVPRPRQVDLKSITEVVEHAENIPWIEGEGFVITDTRCAPGQHSWRRLKVKSLAYVRLHAATASTYANDVMGFCLSTWLNCEEGEVLAYFPQFTVPYDATKNALEQEGGLCSECCLRFNSLLGEHGMDRGAFFRALEDVDHVKRVLTKLYLDKGAAWHERGHLASVADIVAFLRSTKKHRNNDQHTVTPTHTLWQPMKAYLLKVLPAEITQMQIVGARGSHMELADEA